MKTTKHLGSNTYVEIPLNGNGQTRGFALVTIQDHARNELSKLNNILFRKKIEAARSEVKTAKTITKSNHSIRPQVVVNRLPENQGMVNRSKLVPVELSYINAVKSTKLNSGKQNCIIIFGRAYFVEYAFVNLIVKSKMAIQNSKLSPVQTPEKSYTMLTQP